MWGVLYLVGFAAAVWGVETWAATHGRADRTATAGTRTVAGMVATFVYWPLTVVLWRVLYPDLDRSWPFGDRA